MERWDWRVIQGEPFLFLYRFLTVFLPALAVDFLVAFFLVVPLMLSLLVS